MSIEWNKVTWYSKALALAIFIFLSFGGLWIGIQYGEMQQRANDLSTELKNGSVTEAPAQGTSAYYENVSTWQTYQGTQGGFAIAYPIDFPANANYSPNPSEDWQIIGTPAPGILGFTLNIPKVFEPQTNFDDAKLTVGWSGDNVAVAQCMTPDTSGGLNSKTTSTIAINGTAFVIFHSYGVGAGNYYDTTSYRTIHTGKCYAIEYTIHSSQIMNYPAEYQLKPFDVSKLTNVLDRIVGTFKFL